MRNHFQRVLRNRAEIALSAAAIVGWTLVTSAIAHYFAAGVVWRVSAGLFFLSLCGWRMLFKIASSGLYTLSRD